MKTPLVDVQFLSIYEVQGQRVPLPKRMARCTLDVKATILGIAKELKAAGGTLYLSDLFRSYDMQLQAHMDYTSGKKKAFSPAPGGSMHEAGRAFDFDLNAMKIPLAKFWEIAARNGATPIIAEPKTSTSEAWHFDCRGSHQLVYDYYKAGKGNNFKSPAKAMAASAIVAVGLKVDFFEERQDEAYVQSALIRLGYDIGNLDARLGQKSFSALERAGIKANSNNASRISQLDALLQKKFPSEYFDKTLLDD